jgi:hypothetical protein
VPGRSKQGSFPCGHGRFILVPNPPVRLESFLTILAKI